jgi:hypothetical protein
MILIPINKIIAHLKKPHIFTMQGRKWIGKTEVPLVDFKIGVGHFVYVTYACCVTPTLNGKKFLFLNPIVPSKFGYNPLIKNTGG